MVEEGMQVTHDMASGRTLGHGQRGKLQHMAFGDTDIHTNKRSADTRLVSSQRIAVQTSFNLMHVGRLQVPLVRVIITSLRASRV
jgi:hypothetical protein